MIAPRLSDTQWLAQLLLCVLLLFAASPDAAANANCESVPGLTQSYASGWGIDQRNTRYQPRSSLSANNVDTLELKWTYGLASNTPRAYPLVTEDTIFVGDGGRGLVALDRETGCERWLFEHTGNISSAIVRGNVGEQPIVIFTDRFNGGVYAVNADTGTLHWHIRVDDEPVPFYSGTPIVTEDSVYVPVASMEVVLATNPFYGCCTTSGGLAAFDLATGNKRWYLPTIQEPARQTGSHWFFVEEYGPSGAPVWGAPSYDKKRNWLFIGTGQNYTHPATDTSDAIFAIDAATGNVVWRRQYTENDVYTAACNDEAWNHPNCDKPTGPDVDFGAPTLLLTSPGGRELVVAGQKSAEAHAMDRTTGEKVWSTRLGRGGIIGGVHWGLAANESLGLLFVPISDKEIIGFPAPGEPKPGLYALDLDTGAQRWQYERPSRCAEQECVFGLSSAIIAANDIVVTGSMDGYLIVLDARTGKELWVHDAWRDYESVNNVETTGGAFDAHGPMLADDLLIVTAGYGYVGRQRGGNALLVFQTQGQQ